eukprot:11738061-Ditylum_brightwellii.AAC.1
MLKELKSEEILCQQKKLDKEEDENNDNSRKIYFVFGHSQFWAKILSHEQSRNFQRNTHYHSY